MFDISVVGLGYVGLPLCLQFAKNNCRVLGLDIDERKVTSIQNGKSYIHHISSDIIAEQIKLGRFHASSDFSRVAECDAIVICVPTPLNKNREPDISFILDTGKAIAPYLKKGALVVLESTTYPGQRMKIC